jgi:DNA mismatch repair protein MutL
LVDQIAAGEVVERPASVVKELVENAVDAEASRIRIEVREGGTASIAVGDDGHGMSPRDARLALQRHATSKIACAADLQQIRSFGFRGEALAAIASVSRLRLLTRAREADAAFEIRSEAGRIVGESVAGGAVGTRIEVADLFANVPARRKFLKRPATEWGHISDWMTRSALVLPGIHFEIRRDDRPATVWPPTSDPLDRIAALLAEDEAAALIRVEAEEGEVRLQAFVSSPERTRSNASGLFLFVNGRPVRDRLLRHALLDVYRDWLPRGRYPTAVLLLNLPAAEVDVNVHPAKWEIRFAEPQSIHRLVRRALRGAIAGRSWLGRPTPSPAAGEGAGSRRPTGFASAGELSDRVAEEEGASQGGWIEGEERGGNWIFAENARGAPAAWESPRSPAADESVPLRFGDLHLLGQFLASYLLVESKTGLLLVDQHAAHERVLYERMRAEWLKQGVERQALLAPVSVDLELGAAAALLASRERVERLGFEIESFGDDSVMVRTIPALLSGRDPRSLIRSLDHDFQGSVEIQDSGGSEVRRLQGADRIFASLACHAARRAGDHLEQREQQSILDALDAIPWAPTCPHGRPVAVAFDLSEIESRFRRR